MACESGQEKRETLAEILAEIGEMSDWCHNNIGSKTWEDWEKMHEWLLDIRRRFETAVLRKAIELSKRFVPGNAAAMRDALVEARQIVAYAAHRRFGFMRAHNGSTKVIIASETLEKVDAALSAPARNCDIGKYATVEGASTGLDEFCKKWLCSGNWCCDCPYFSEEHLMPCGAKWLLALAAERKGDSDGR